MDSNYFSPIGENIKRLREERGLSQTELASLCGMKDAQLRRYELNKTIPRKEQIQRIAGALQVDSRELYGSIKIITDEEPLNFPQLFAGIKKPKQNVTMTIDNHVYSGSPDSADTFKYIVKLKKICELLSLGNVQWTETEKNGVAGLEFSFGEKDDDKYFLTKEQTILLPEVTIEQAKALIRSLDRQNREQGS